MGERVHGLDDDPMASGCCWLLVKLKLSGHALQPAAASTCIGTQSLVMCAGDIWAALIFPFTTLPNISTVMAGPFITTTPLRHHTGYISLCSLSSNREYVAPTPPST